MKDINYMCNFDCNSYPGALAFATEDYLTIVNLEEIQQLNIRSVPLDETPRRITHQESTHTFSLATFKTVMSDYGEIVETGHIKLLTDQTFEVKDCFNLNPFEYPNYIISTTLQNKPEPGEVYIVGTTYIHSKDAEATSGRIIVLSVVDDKYRLNCEIAVNGPLNTLAPFHGKFLAGIGTKLQLFKYKDDGLVMECEERGFIQVMDLTVRDNFILIADVMKSVSLVMYTQLDDCSAFKSIGKNNDAYWMTAASMFDDDYFIGAEENGHIISFRKNSGALLEEERDRLDVSGRFNVNDNINRIREGTLVMKKYDPKSNQNTLGRLGNTVIFAGTSGAIGLVSNIDEQTFALLERVQKSLTSLILSIGGLSSEQWRNFEGDKKSENVGTFIDGDLVESFLDLPIDKQLEVAKEVSIPLDELHTTIETIARGLH